MSSASILVLFSGYVLISSVLSPVRTVPLSTIIILVSMFDFHRSDRGSNPARGDKKFNNVYDYTIERHPWQVSETHKPRVHPSHVREIW